MRKIVLGLFIAASSLASAPVWADAAADDAAWIKKCQEDNKQEGATAEVVTKYCACMNEKMSADEKKSVSEWEKTHAKEMAECDAAAGWTK